MDNDFMLEEAGWRKLLEDIAARFDELTLMRGFQYYKQGRVESFEIRDGAYLDARIKDNRMYETVVDLFDVAASTCECPVDRACTHMAAALLHYAELCGRPIQSVVNARATVRAMAKAAAPESAPRRIAGSGVNEESTGSAGRASLNGAVVGSAGGAVAGAGMSTGIPGGAGAGARVNDGTGAGQGAGIRPDGASSDSSDMGAAGSNEPVSPRFSSQPARAPRPIFSEQELTDLPVAQWHERFGVRKGPLHAHLRTSQEANELMADLHAMAPPLPLALEQLFNLHVHLYALDRMVGPIQADWRQSGFFLGYHAQLAMDGLLAAVRKLLEEQSAIASEDSAYWPRLLETVDFIRTRMLTEDKTVNGFSSLYPMLWTNWLGPSRNGSPELYEEELRKLSEAEQTLGNALSPLAWTLAQCLLLIYLERDGKALALLAARGGKLMLKPAPVMPLLAVIAGQQRWERLRDWLVAVGPLFVNQRAEELPPYADYWMLATENLPEAESDMWRTLAGMLPASRHIYEEALVAYGRWKLWVDYQICKGEDPLSFRVAAFKPIEKEAPELLLPFFHQAVERYVLQKNRDGYKAATKLLKRLAKLYARMKREERWEQFMAAFVSRNSRLRALQEELRKGGLLS